MFVHLETQRSRLTLLKGVVMKKSLLVFVIAAMGLLPALALANGGEARPDVQKEKQVLSDLNVLKAQAPLKRVVMPAKHGKAYGVQRPGMKPSFNSNQCRGTGCAVRQVFDHPIISKDGLPLSSSARAGDEGRSHDLMPSSGYERPEGQDAACQGPSCGVGTQPKSERLSNGNVARQDKIDGQPAAPAALGSSKAASSKEKGCRGAACVADEARRAQCLQQSGRNP